MPAPWKPIPDHTYLVSGLQTIVEGCPVVVTATPDQVGLPLGTAADLIVGVAQADVGPLALGQAINNTAIPVQVFGTAKCFAKGTIAAGSMVRIFTATINVTPPGYAAAVAVWPVSASTQTAAGSQPFPVLGRARNATTTDGDIVYVDLIPGATY